MQMSWETTAVEDGSYGTISKDSLPLCAASCIRYIPSSTFCAVDASSTLVDPTSSSRPEVSEQLLFHGHGEERGTRNEGNNSGSGPLGADDTGRNSGLSLAGYADVEKLTSLASSLIGELLNEI